MSSFIVLGRFQPFHKGHEYLVNCAFALAGDAEVIIAIGSSAKGWESDNPWTLEERTEMINSWLAEHNKTARIVGVTDINDPPNWVTHAREFHGEGILVTSDKATKELYEESDFKVNLVDLSNRENYEGWRVRQTLLMLSTVYDDAAVKAVLSATIPQPVIDWLVDNDAIFRLSTMVSGVNVG